MSSVFLSYAEEDGTLALRVQEDLAGAKLQVWRYERDARIGVDYRQEYRSQIESASFFCLLDSPAARRSPYVREECELARKLEAVNGQPSFVSCLAAKQPDSDVEAASNELFPGQNTIQYLDLADYERGIRRLCRHFGCVYVPRFHLPRDLDLEREVFSAGLQNWQVESLLEMYRRFRALYGDDRRLAAAQLELLVRQCEDLGARPVFSPRIALGVLQGDGGRFSEARETFAELVRLCPGDPRLWAGLGGAQSYLAQPDEALRSFETSLALLQEAGAAADDPHVLEVTHNIGKVLLVLGRLDEAWQRLADLPHAAAGEPYLQALRGQIQLARGQPDSARRLLEEALEAYQSTRDLDASLVTSLADCYRSLREPEREAALLQRGEELLPEDAEIKKRRAELFLRQGLTEHAVSSLRKAIRCDPSSVPMRSELALLLARLGREEEARHAAHQCLRPREESPRERYYRGLALYLLGVEDLARRELEEARQDPVVAGWPPYEDLR